MLVCEFHSYLLAVGLECGRILLYRWNPGQEAAGGHDWRSCAETDTSYPWQHICTCAKFNVSSWCNLKRSLVATSSRCE